MNVRQELDLRFGAAFTRLQTLTLQRVYPSLKVVSYGPCQFPTLGFVVDRFLQHDQFVPEPFWKLSLSLQVENTKTDFTWERGRLFDRLSCLVLLEMCLDDPVVVVKSVEKREKKKLKPLPLATVEMQKRASRWLRMSSKRTMEVAEGLYNRGFISYPRTETDRFSPETDLRAVVSLFTGQGEYSQYANRLLGGGAFQPPRAGQHDDKAHPPITPTKLASGLNPEEQRLYDLIVIHFLACCSKDAVGNETNVCVEVSGEIFRVRGLMIEERNYLDIYKYDKWTAHQIPLFKVGDRFLPSSLTMNEGHTTAPPLLTESDLISLMDKEGIGTDATIAQHIDTIQKREYAYLEGRVFKPTELGVALVESYKLLDLLLSTPELRSKMEWSLKQIAVGQKEARQVEQEFTEAMKGHFLTIEGRKDEFVEYMKRFLDPREYNVPEEVVSPGIIACGVCRHPMDMKEGK